MTAKNSTSEATFRRLQDNLVVLGTGIMALGAWVLLKMVLICVLTSSHIHHQVLEATPDAPVYAAYLAIVIVTLLDLSMRAFVGLSARAEGFGKREGFAYLVVAGLMATGCALSIITSAMTLFALEATAFDSIVTLSIESTSFFVFVLLIKSSIRLKRMTRPVG